MNAFMRWSGCQLGAGLALYRLSYLHAASLLASSPFALSVAKHLLPLRLTSMAPGLGTWPSGAAAWLPRAVGLHLQRNSPTKAVLA
jgi:hypothetical protein